MKAKTKSSKRKGKDIKITITEEDYQQSLAEGATEEDAMKPGKHTFRRFRDNF